MLSVGSLSSSVKSRFPMQQRDFKPNLKMMRSIELEEASSACITLEFCNYAFDLRTTVK
jgi:hypothetical protein